MAALSYGRPVVWSYAHGRLKLSVPSGIGIGIGLTAIDQL